MDQYVILGLENDPRLWLVDFAQQTVTPVDAAAVGGHDASGVLADAISARASGTPDIKGVDLAVAARARSDAAAQSFSFSIGQ